MSNSPFLNSLKEELNSLGIFEPLKNFEFTDYILNSKIPALCSEFIEFSDSELTTLISEEDLDKCQERIVTLQQRLDRLTYENLNHLSMYSDLTRIRTAANSYIQLNVEDVTKLKNKESREAAAEYILEDFDRLIFALDDFFSIIEKQTFNIKKALSNIDLLLSLRSQKKSQMVASSRYNR